VPAFAAGARQSKCDAFHTALYNRRRREPRARFSCEVSKRYLRTLNARKYTERASDDLRKSTHCPPQLPSPR